MARHAPTDRQKRYFERIAEMDAELARKGVEVDETLYRRLNEWIDEDRARERERRGRGDP